LRIWIFRQFILHYFKIFILDNHLSRGKSNASAHFSCYFSFFLMGSCEFIFLRHPIPHKKWYNFMQITLDVIMDFPK
jgi:hypothetical protein